VFLYSSDYPPNDGGIARLCAGLAASWPNFISKPGVLYHSRDAAPRIHPSSGDIGIRIVGPRILREWRSFRFLRRVRDPGFVVCGLWYPDALIALLAGVGPLVILAHGSELMPAAGWRRSVWRRLLRWVCESADLVVANSSYTRALVLKAAPHSNVAVVPLAVDHQRFCPGDKERARAQLGAVGRLVISSVSRLHPYKGHDVVLQALAALPPEQRSQILYLVAGKGPHLTQLQSQSAELGLQESVRFLGFVSDDDLPGLYRASDLFVLCTREHADRREVEGFGMVFLEAQSCGTPVVGTRTGGIPDAVIHNRGGWLIDQNDVPELTSILTHLAGDPAFFREAGSVARQRVIGECTWDHYVGRLQASLEAGGIRVA
jgi:phosphatidylinositol alpha-1,6-mannosyltransferase